MHEAVRSARLDGEILARWPEHLIRTLPRIAAASVWSFQRPNPFPKSIFDNVAYGLRINGSNVPIPIGRKKLGVRRLGRSEDHLHSPRTNFPVAQQQRLCIARVLPSSPKCFFSTNLSALDPISTAKIEGLLVQLKDLCTIVTLPTTCSRPRALAIHGVPAHRQLIEFKPDASSSPPR